MGCRISRFGGKGMSYLLFAAVLAPGTAVAVEPLDQFSARLGGFVSRFDTKVRADGETGTGTEIDLRRDLALDPENAVGFAVVTWRPFDRHEFAFGYFRDDASGRHQLEREIEFDGQVYEAAATVSADYGIEAYEISYTWWGVSREDWALGPRLGLVWYKMDLGVELELTADGEPVADGALERHASVDVPAPAIGVGWRWTPGEDWRLLAELGYFSTSIDDFDGDVTYGRAGVEWHPWERVGLMLDYTRSSIDVEADRSSFDGTVDFTNSGLRLGVVFRY